MGVEILDVVGVRVKGLDVLLEEAVLPLPHKSGQLVLELVTRLRQVSLLPQKGALLVDLAEHLPHKRVGVGLISLYTQSPVNILELVNLEPVPESRISVVQPGCLCVASNYTLVMQRPPLTHVEELAEELSGEGSVPATVCVVDEIVHALCCVRAIVGDVWGVVGRRVLPSEVPPDRVALHQLPHVSTQVLGDHGTVGAREAGPP